MKILKTEEKNKIQKKEISKEIDKKNSNRIFINLLIAILIMIYFCTLSIVYKKVSHEQIINIVKGSTLVFLGITLVLIEIAFKKESKRVFIHSLEILFLAVHSLTTMHVIKMYAFDFQKYILTSSYSFSIYYVLKTLIINTKARRDYLKGLSDIQQIVEKDEPIKKEATKKEIVEEETPNENNAKIKNESRSLDEEIEGSKIKIKK